jgi:hypothetical protein
MGGAVASGSPARAAALGLVALAIGLAALCSLAGETAVAAAPVVSTGPASNVTSSSATLHGSINPNGSTVSFVFQFGTTRHYGGQTPAVVAGGGNKTIRVSQTIAGLRADTTYHYRLVALAATATFGGDRTFTTAKVPLSLSIHTSPDPAVFGSPFLVQGTMSGTGAAGRLLVLKVNPFPYRGFAAFGNPEPTSASGSFSFFAAGLLENTQVLVTTAGKPHVTSPVVFEGVAVRVKLHVRHTRRRGFVRFYGTVAPAEAGALVGFQRLVPHHRSVNVGGTVVRAATPSVSQFSRVVRVRHGSLYRALVRITDPAHVSGRSQIVLVR